MIVVKTVGLKENQAFFRKYGKGIRPAMRRANSRVAKSLAEKAKHIIRTETITHTGLLKSDVRSRPVGELNFMVVAGEYTNYAHIIESGRKAVMGYKFVPTQQFPLEGYGVRRQGSYIRPAKGIFFMERGRIHAENKVVPIFVDELRKLGR